MARLQDVLVGKLALRRELVTPAALRDCMAAQQRQLGAGLGQILVERRLIQGSDLIELLRAAERAELSCPRCQGLFGASTLDPQGGLACPRCGGALQILFEGVEVSDRLTTGRTGRLNPGPAPTPALGPPVPAATLFDSKPPTRRDSSTGSGSRTMPRATVGLSGSLSGSLRGGRGLGGEFSSGTFGPYELVEELGRGGMGVVFKARQPHLDRYVALKVLLSGELASPKQIKRFQREAEITARLKHPSIVQIHDVGQVADYHYFTMDFIDGTPLNQLIKRKQLGIRRAVEIARDVARGLEHAHQRGAIHRDIKPANILVDRDGHGVITDFGLARDMDPDALSQLTRSGAAVGTPYYMSPEQAQGKREEVSGSTDVYSLGVVLYESLTFELPFRGETQLELTTRILTEEPTPPTRIEPAIDRDVETIVLKAMAKEPRERYANAGLLADDLERYLRGEPILARRRSPLERFARAARRHVLTAAGLLLATAAVALVTYTLVRHPAATTAEGSGSGDPASSPTAPSPSATPAEDPAVVKAREARQCLREVERVTARPGYRAALEQQVLPALGAALELAADDAGLRLLRGRCLERLRRFQAARDDYAAVIQAEAQGAAGAEAAFRLARMLQRRALGSNGKLEPEPSQILEAGLARAGEAAGAWRELLRAYLAMGRDQDGAAAAGAVARAAALAPDLPEVSWLQATLAGLAERLQEAATAAQKALELDGKDAWSWALMGRLRAMTGSAERALQEEVVAALELDPLNEDALLLRIAIERNQKDLTAALRDLRVLVAEHPKDKDLLLMLAQLSYLNDQDAEAERVLQQLEGLAPDQPEPILARVARRVAKDDFAGAVATLVERLLQLKTPALREALETQLMKLVLGGEFYDEGRAYANKCLERDPKDVRAQRILLEIDFDAGNEEQAFARLDAVLAEQPAIRELRELELRAFNRYRTKEELQARLEVFARDFARDPKGQAFVARALSVILGDDARAQSLALEVLRADPGNVDALTMVGLIAMRQRRFKEAREALQRAATADPFRTEAVGLLAMAEAELGNLSAADAAFTAALSSDPFDANAAFNFASFMAEHGKLERGISLLRGFLKQYESTHAKAPGPLAVRLAELLARKGDFAQAIRIAREVADKIPGNPEIEMALATILAQAGQLDEARERVGKLLEANPDFEPAQRLREQLNR